MDNNQDNSHVDRSDGRPTGHNNSIGGAISANNLYGDDNDHRTGDAGPVIRENGVDGDDSDVPQEDQEQHSECPPGEVGLLEMTQDVIEWDDGSAFDGLIGSARRGARGGNKSSCSSKNSTSRRNSRTPPVPTSVSASACRSNNSSIFTSTVKRFVVDPLRQQNSSEAEASGATNNNTTHDKSDSAVRHLKYVNETGDHRHDGTTTTSDSRDFKGDQTPLEKKKENDSEITGILSMLQSDTSNEDDNDECTDGNGDAVSNRQNNGGIPFARDRLQKIPTQQQQPQTNRCQGKERPRMQQSDQNHDSCSNDNHTTKVLSNDDNGSGGDDYDCDDVNELQLTQRRNNKRAVSLDSNSTSVHTHFVNKKSNTVISIDAAATSLASRYRRRQDGGVDFKRLKSHGEASTSRSPSPTASNDANSNRSFDGLLQEILTPPPTESHRQSLPSMTASSPQQRMRAPLASVDNNNMSTLSESSVHPEKQGTPPRPSGMVSLQQNCSSAQQVRVRTNQHIESTVNTHMAGCSPFRRSQSLPLPSRIFADKDTSYRPISQPMMPTSLTTKDGSNLFVLEQHTTTSCGKSSVPSINSHEQTMIHSTSQSTNVATAFPSRDANDSASQQRDNEASSSLQPSVPNEEIQANHGENSPLHHGNDDVGTGNSDDEDDEFGDFLTDMDLEGIDQAVANRTSEPSQRQNPTEKEEDEFGDLDDDAFCQIDELIATRGTTARKSPQKIKTSTDDENDEFGNLSDLDLSEIDAQVENRMRSGTSHSLPPGSEIVRNLKHDPEIRDNDSLSRMRYSRYMVLDVASDQQMRRKTLSVASWTRTMINDLDRTKLHKNCSVTLASRESSTAPSAEFLHSFVPRSRYQKEGEVILKGEWFHTAVEAGDIIHICSLTGKYRTDRYALPITLHDMPPVGSDIDDLLLVLHPDNLLSPSVISETQTCSRRAVLNSRIGSSGMNNEAALIGTLRHTLFESCMGANIFSDAFARKIVQEAVIEKSEDLVGCDLSEHDVVQKVLTALPRIREFAEEYVSSPQQAAYELSDEGKPVPGNLSFPDIALSSPKIHSTEEYIVSQELGLKGSLDTVLEADLKVINRKKHPVASGANLPNRDEVAHRSLVAIELKTSHNQTFRFEHGAQLSFYNLMLQGRYGTQAQLYGNQLSQPPRLESDKMDCDEETGSKDDYGAAMGGLLLYLNDKAFSMSHVSAQLNEIKLLIGQRNGVAGDLQRASRPRGISLAYGDGLRNDSESKMSVIMFPPPPVPLPELLASSYKCGNCFSKRECMVYAAADGHQNENHSRLLEDFTGHLDPVDLDYFRKWNRLLDLEAEASNRVSVLESVCNSGSSSSDAGDDREVIHGFRFLDEIPSDATGVRSDPILWFEIACPSNSMKGLHLSSGSSIHLSIDRLQRCGVDKNISERDRNIVFKGSVVSVDGMKIAVRSSNSDLKLIRRLVRRYGPSRSPGGTDMETDHDGGDVLFCVQMNHTVIGMGTLRWNLINFFAQEPVPRNVDPGDLLKIRLKNARLAKLRSLIIHKRPPVYHASLLDDHCLFDFNYPGNQGGFSSLKNEFEQLNDGQKSAVHIAFLAQDFSLIQGFPGTGKTSVITFLARLLVAHGKRVLITAYTHSAVDNIMMKLMDKGLGMKDQRTKLSSLVRVGRENSCHTYVKPITHTELAADYIQTSCVSSFTNTDEARPSAESLRAVIKAARIVGVSALTLPRSQLLRQEQFDVVIIDEAGQMNQPATLGVLTHADSFVLVGDHKQLPPLVNSGIADAGGYGDSLMKHLAGCHPSSVVQLTTQYRMNESICRITSNAFYDGRLECSGEEQKAKHLDLPQLLSNIPGIAENDACWPWLQAVIDPSNPVVFVDTDKIRTSHHHPPQDQSMTMESLEGKNGTGSKASIVNHAEAALVKKIVEGFHCYGGLDLSSVGIVSPFRAQIKIMESIPAMEKWKNQGMELSTVDSYQGRDKPAIIIPLVRSNSTGKAGRLLQDDRRLNVALTRAKYKLILVGSFSTLRTGSAPLRPILDLMKQRNEIVALPPNALEQCSSL
mmetsp:Transcript_7691/g.19016  ORF Transcript_7691/g.19016 Transcript_7691/m.19016 type:complete len:2040 (-) Transcript_7691:119-6238(-)